MQRLMLFVLLVTLAACATQQAEEVREEENQAIRDFIEVRGLEEVDKIRSDRGDGWERIADKFLIYRTRRDSYLFEFARRCYELDDNTNITPDVRSDPNTIRARFETLRGCRIHKIYALTEAEATELASIGEAPGSRN